MRDDVCHMKINSVEKLFYNKIKKFLWRNIKKFKWNSSEKYLQIKSLFMTFWMRFLTFCEKFYDSILLQCWKFFYGIKFYFSVLLWRNSKMESDFMWKLQWFTIKLFSIFIRCYQIAINVKFPLQQKSREFCSHITIKANS